MHMFDLLAPNSVDSIAGELKTTTSYACTYSACALRALEQSIAPMEMFVIVDYLRNNNIILSDPTQRERRRGLCRIGCRGEFHITLNASRYSS